MALNCPTCKTPLERNGETAHCATCDKDFTVQALCPECHQALQVLKPGGPVDYSSKHGHVLIPAPYTHFGAHKTRKNLVCGLRLEKKKDKR